MMVTRDDPGPEIRLTDSGPGQGAGALTDLFIHGAKIDGDRLIKASEAMTENVVPEFFLVECGKC